MTSPLMFLEKLEQIKVEESAEIAIEETSEIAAEAQRQQLAQGLDRFDKNITNQITGSDEYSESYARKKGKRKPIDLHDLGNYYAGIALDLRNDGTFVMFSQDEKGPMLHERYNALGLGSTARMEWITNGLRNRFMNVTFKPIIK